MVWPLTDTIVKTWTDIDDETTDESLALAVAAVNDYVPTIPALAGYYVEAEDPEDPPEFDPPADVTLGAAMLASRWHARRGSTLGTTGYTEFGTGMIMRHDPDIARMLRIGTSSPVFSFGAPSLPVDDEEA